MKLFKYIIFIFLLSINTSCNNKEKTDKSITVKEINQIPNYKKIKLNIKGMTCEIGCARLIDSKLSKTEGVKYTKVSYKDSLGLVEYDSNILSKKDITNIVEQIAGGTLYKVTSSKTVTDFTLEN